MKSETYDSFGVNSKNSFNTPPSNFVKQKRKSKFDPVKASAPMLLSTLEGLLKIAEKQLDQSATHEGLVNCQALANARETLRKAKGEA
jgi:hypothetical protein